MSERRKRIALISCEAMPDVADDDLALVLAFEALGCEVLRPAWTTPQDWSRFDACLLRTPWDYHPRAPEFLAWCEATSTQTKLFHGAEVVRWNMDKRYLFELEALGVPLAPSALVQDIASLAEAKRRFAGADAFIKPIVGANSWRTLRLSSDEASWQEAARLVEASGGAAFLVQPYLESVEAEGELSVFWLGGELTHGVRKCPQPGDYRVQEDFGAKDMAWEPTAEALALAQTVVRLVQARFPELLYGRVDLLRHQGQLVLNEFECIEPCLFLRHGPKAAETLAQALLARL